MGTLKDLLLKFYLRLQSIIPDEKGQTLVEYGFLLILVAVLLIFMVKGTGRQINSEYYVINNALGNLN